jgi:hypothetical protein
VAQAVEGPAGAVDALGPPEIARPGGERLSGELLRGAGVDPAARVVQLVPGAGETTRAIVAIGPRTLVCVTPEQAGARALGRVLPRVQVLTAPLTATGLPEGTATSVVGEGVLTRTPPEARGPLVDEARRLLRAGGRLGLHEVCLRPGDDPGADRDALEQLAEAGVHPLTEGAARGLLEERGLVAIGETGGPVVWRRPAEAAREIGPKGILATMEALGRDRASARRLTRARSLLERHLQRLQAVVVIGERPLIGGMRRSPGA